MYQKRCPTEAELTAWFGNGRQPDGLAVILGEVSGGLVCRDFDKPDAYDRWASAHPDLARTLPTVKTGRGWHVYFHSTRQVFSDLGDGELRGDSLHYCLLPPSSHPSGGAYRWVVELPGGELPIIDPAAAGLADETECTEPTESTEETEDTEETEKPNSSDGERSGGTYDCVSLSVLSVSSAHEGALADQIEAAISATIPTGSGKRNRAVFEFARALKGIPALTDAAPASLRAYAQQWHARAYPVIGTKPFDDTWADFLVAWDRVRFPRGQSPVDIAVDQAKRNPPPVIVERYDAPETRLLVCICRELQRLSGDAPFFLSARTAGRLVKLDHPTAWRRLRMLEVDGVLTAAQRGHEHRATRYRYMGGD